MIGDVNLSDLIRVQQIRHRSTGIKRQERNKNFEEFTDVYKEAISKKLSHPSILKSNYGNGSYDRYPRRPLHEIKKILIEMPALGAEQAILPVLKGSKPLKKKDKCLLTEDTITKWGKKVPKSKVAQKDCMLGKDSHLFLEQTKQEIDESEAQLDEIKSLLNQIKLPEKIKKSKVLTYKAKKKPDRHAECINKKYMTTLNTMQQKLQKLEDKYFSKPHVIYKSVRDICTEFSNGDIPYDYDSSIINVNANEPLEEMNQDLDSSVIDDLNISETLEGIKQELDTIANSSLEQTEIKPRTKTVTFKAPEVELNTVGDTFDVAKSIEPMNFSFKMPLNIDDDNRREPYSALIDQSENWLKKYNFFSKSLDIEKFCSEVCDFVDSDRGVEVKDEDKSPKGSAQKVTALECDNMISLDDSDKESHDSDVDDFYHGGSPSLLNKELNSVVASSSYLSKELKSVKPSVRVFSGTDRYVDNKYFDAKSKSRNSAGPSITDLIDNLSMSLKGSIYYSPV